ncbi:MAG: 2-amino-3,7-dideoxy-D-threo-hept-6-ulosonate synthase [Myxococcota bacterium]|nr:2-amino-3,7-dideoxy-D-threo-hept-6-ulosonate synthase [Myxococcota bacterium]
MKDLRLRRCFREDRTLMVPLDHGMTQGPLVGLQDLEATVQDLVESRVVDVVVLHKGPFEAVAPILARSPEIATILHLSASVDLSPDPDRKVVVSSVEDALRLGADGVSVHVNLGHSEDAAMLEEVGRVAGDCQRWGMPLLAMVYLRGGEEPLCGAEAGSTAARVAWELGADAVKLDYTGSPESFAEVARSAPIPMLVAGGSTQDELPQLLGVYRDALEAGASGLSVGRNVFQRRERRSLLRALDRLVHDGAALDEALAAMEG